MLASANIANLAQPSNEPLLEDDEILITPNVHVQIGCGYMNVVRDLADGRMEFTRATERTLVAKILAALKDAEDEPTPA
jgi:hypothetical protein